MPPPADRLTRWLGPPPGAREARLIASCAILAALLMTGLSIHRGLQGQTFMGRPFGGDFGQFYAVGRILNDGQAARLYSIPDQLNSYRRAVPEAPGDYHLVFANAPVIAALFRPLALLDYRQAFIVWLVISPLLFGLALHLLGLRPYGVPWLLAVSWVPFLFETWFGGQIPVFGLLAFSLFFWLRQRGWLLAAGVALALASYKPTLVLVPAVMLLCGRQWRTLAGFSAGAAGMLALSAAVAGPNGLAGWFEALQFYGNMVSGQFEALRRYKYLDAGSFMHLLFGSGTRLATLAGLTVSAALLALLARAWWSAPRLDPRGQDLLWTATLALAPVVNLYVPIYDAVLLIPGAVLAARHLEGPSWRWWLTALYLSPWITQSAAEFLRFQFLTLVLIAFGWWCLRQAGIRPQSAPATQADVSGASPCAGSDGMLP
ncbi:MAG TPA: glycosyltransferase family 87 protein [Bryobacteraceae bacterium]|nr:glycosyltransferase family 87 protein [Bryobacteraceae bacterium]